MARHRILVVDDSAAMRETLCVLLGGAYAVHAVAPPELRDWSDTACDLTIASAALRGSPALPAAARLWLGDTAERGGMPRRFTPSDLRRQVRAAIQVAAGLAADDASHEPTRDWRLQPPFLDAHSGAIAKRARDAGLALHICGEPGSGKDAVARAVHAGRGTLHVCDDASPIPPLADLTPDSTLLLIGVDRWPNASRRALSALLAAPPTHRLRVISTATHDLAELLDRGEFLPDLYYRLTLLTIQLRPLRDRPDEIPALAEALAAEIADDLGRPRPVFSEAARHRLSHYLWFGNLAELQAVLTRTLALNQHRSIEADDLRFDGAEAVPVAASLQGDTATEGIEKETAEKDTTEPSYDQATSANLNLIIHELAHEFKNPLVTIKTFTQHCQKTLLESEPDALEFAEITGRAVDKIDDTLENLLAFARMSQPSPRNVSLDSLLGPIFANGTGLNVEYRKPPHVNVRIDPEQASYAVDNLLRALARDVPADQPVTAQFFPPDSLLCQLPAGTLDSRDTLKQLVAESDEDQAEAIPLGIAIASAILQRNGAELRLSRNGEPKTVMIRFPLVENEEEEEANRNGTSPNTDR